MAGVLAGGWVILGLIQFGELLESLERRGILSSSSTQLLPNLDQARRQAITPQQ